MVLVNLKSFVRKSTKSILFEMKGGFLTAIAVLEVTQVQGDIYSVSLIHRKVALLLSFVCITEHAEFAENVLS